VTVPSISMRVQDATREAYARMNPPLTRFYVRWRWTLLPLAIALGMRTFLLFCTQLGVRLVAPHSQHGLFTIWARYDALWYLDIVRNGYSYPGHPTSNVNFFPLYPILIWLGQHLLEPFAGARAPLITAMAISWLAFAVAAVMLYRLTLDRFGRQVAMFTVVLLSTFPFGMFFGAPYTESLYLMLAVGAFLAIERRLWWLAGAAALFAGAVRPPGILVGICVVLAYALDWYTTRHPLRRDVLALALTPLGLFGYMLYCQIRFGDALAYVHAAGQGWQRGGLSLGGVGWLLSLLAHPAQWFVSGDLTTIIWTLYAFMMVASLIAVYFIYRKIGPVYAFFTLAGVLMPLLTDATPTSLGRYVSVAFPLFMILALALHHRAALRELVVTSFSGLLVIAAILFAQGRGIY
jgi:hypothetical protein